MAGVLGAGRAQQRPAGEQRQAQAQRRTQVQRSAEMRERLLDATVECLVEYGYAGTTTPRVAAKAGVTRGAQVHHFRAKTDLVVAAIKHLAAKRMDTVLRELETVERTGDSLGAVLDFLWEVHQGPLFLATAELWIAARTDRTLAAELAGVEPYVNNALFEAVAQFVLPDGMRKEVREFVYTAMDAIRGIVISGFVDADPQRARLAPDRAVTHLRVVGVTDAPRLR